VVQDRNEKTEDKEDKDILHSNVDGSPKNQEDDSSHEKGSLTVVDEIEEEMCLKLILNPEFVENLSVLKQKSGSTNYASTQSEVE